MGKKRDVKRHLTGLSLGASPDGSVSLGVEWERTPTSRTAAYRVPEFLADRRVLFNPYWREQADECAASVVDVRRKLTDEIEGLSDDVVLTPHLRAMRGACRQFLDRLGEARASERDGLAYRELTDNEVPLILALGELRALVGVQIALIASAFDLEIPETLWELVPAAADDDDGSELAYRPRRPW